MPSWLALILCIAFVLSLLAVEHRNSRGLSGSLWIPTVWMFLCASKSLNYFFALPGNAGNDSGSPLDRSVLALAGAAGIVVLSRRRVNLRLILRQHKWLFILLSYMLLSTMWSEMTDVAIRRWFRASLLVIMALVVVSERSSQMAFESVIRRTAYVLIPFSILLIKYYPWLGVEYGRWSGQLMWIGVTTQKNSLGRLCLVSVFFFLWVFYRDRVETARRLLRRRVWTDILVVAMALYLLKGHNGVYSATSLATLGVGCLTFAVLHVLQRWRTMIPLLVLEVAVIVLIGFGISGPFGGGSHISMFSSSLGRDETLTGRTDIWSWVVPDARQHLLVGVGFGSYWTDARRALFRQPNGHNGYLDTILDLGVIGLAFYMFWLLSTVTSLHRALARDRPTASFAICFLVMTLVYNATESALSNLVEPMIVVLALTSFVSVQELAYSIEEQLDWRAAGTTDPGVARVCPGGRVWWRI